MPQGKDMRLDPMCQRQLGAVAVTKKIETTGKLDSNISWLR